MLESPDTTFNVSTKFILTFTHWHSKTMKAMEWRPTTVYPCIYDCVVGRKCFEGLRIWNCTIEGFDLNQWEGSICLYVIIYFYLLVHENKCVSFSLLNMLISSQYACSRAPTLTQTCSHLCVFSYFSASTTFCITNSIEADMQDCRERHTGAPKSALRVLFDDTWVIISPMSGNVERIWKKW